MQHDLKILAPAVQIFPAIMQTLWRLLQLERFPSLVVGTSILVKPGPGFIGLFQEVFHVNVHKFTTRDVVFYDLAVVTGPLESVLNHVLGIDMNKCHPF